MSRRSARLGISRTSVVALILSLGLLIALVVPAIQAAREAARRTQCCNNLTLIVLNLDVYHQAFKTYPAGVMHSGPSPGGPPPIEAALGPSWWFENIKMLSLRVDVLIERSQNPSQGARPTFCANDLKPHLKEFTTIGPTWFEVYMRCPSSSLPAMETADGPIVLPTYVGIAGGCDIDPDSQDYKTSGGAPAGLIAPTTDTIYHNKFKGPGAAAGGIVTSSGLLPPCQQVRLADCVDGTANTMIVAEQSDWLLDQNPKSSKKYHGDPGWTVGGTGPGGGWISGTRRVDPVPEIDTPGGPPAIWGADCWNITTVRYPPNFKRVMGPTPWPGCSENHGINNPLQSPHPGGLLVAMADGSVRFISQKTALEVLLRLAIRNDGVSPELP
jgi:hypothetical protein